MSTYWVRCNAVSTLNFKVTVWDSTTVNAKPIPDPLVVTAPTTIELLVDYDHSDASMQGFTIRVNPSNVKNITVNQVGTTDIKINDPCAVKEDIYLHLTAWKGGNGYATDSGKPIIRNNPLQTLPPTRLFVIAALVLVAAVCVFAVGRYVGWW